MFEHVHREGASCQYCNHGYYLSGGNCAGQRCTRLSTLSPSLCCSVPLLGRDDILQRLARQLSRTVRVQPRNSRQLLSVFEQYHVLWKRSGSKRRQLSGGVICADVCSRVHRSATRATRHRTVPAVCLITMGLLAFVRVVDATMCHLSADVNCNGHGTPNSPTSCACAAGFAPPL